MIEIQIAYQGQLRCRAVHGPSGTALETDAPADNMGKGEKFSPTDLVATALGTCILTILGIQARKRGLDLGPAAATVRKEMTADPVRRIGRLSVTVRVPADLPEEERRRLEAAAHTCPVGMSLHPDVQVAIDFRWGN